MAKLPQIKRLNVEDFASQQSWIGKLFLILNTFMEATVNALNHGISIEANTTSQISTLTAVAIPTPSAPLKPAWRGKYAPSGVLLIGAIPTNYSYVAQTVPCGIQWLYDAKNGLQITNLIGVTPTNNLPYLLTFLIIGG